MKKVLVNISLTMILITLSSCDWFTSPEELEPGRRDYTWTADTLKNHRVMLHRIWGSSPNDVWANGSGSSRVNLWHFDGNEWKTDSVQRLMTPWGIWGSASNNVWLGTNNSSIWRYNGLEWSQSYTINYQDYDVVTIHWIAGTSRNNVYGVGFAGKYNEDDYTNIIVKYEVLNWEMVPIPKNRIILNTCAVQESSGLLFISGTNYEEVWTEKLLVFNGSNLVELYSGPDYMFVYNIAGEVYFTQNTNIYKFEMGKLNLLKSFNGTKFVGFLWGVNEKDIFYKAIDGIGHYNGKNTETLYETGLDIISGYRIGTDIFVIAYDRNEGNSVIIHGKLSQ